MVFAPRGSYNSRTNFHGLSRAELLRQLHLEKPPPRRFFDSEEAPPSRTAFSLASDESSYASNEHSPIPDALVMAKRRPAMRSEALSAIAIVAAFVLPLTIVGITDASTTRNRSTP